MNIIFEPILLPQLKPLLLYRKPAKNIALFMFFINDIFRVFKNYEQQYIFLHNFFFCAWFSPG